MLTKGVVALLLVCFSTGAAAQPLRLSLEPRLDVNYVPDSGSDEGGFWYRVEQLEKETRRSPYRIRDEQINAYLKGLVCRLAGDYCGNIRVYLIDNPHFNASMYPNGMMHIWSGLLLRVENEAQLASILGHEIGHYLMAHQIEQYRQARDGSAFAMVLDIGIGALTGIYGIASLGMSGSGVAFSREHEYEADILGLELMTRIGYQPRQAGKLWESIASERNADQSKEETSLFWATHPPSEKRASKLAQHALQLTEHYADAEDVGKDNLVNAVQSIYPRIMANHISLQEYEQAALLLEKHKRLGYPNGQVDFFTGELYRLQGGASDLEKAISAYQRSTRSPDCPVDAHKQLGYMYIKSNNNSEALNQFRKYLEKQPNASDKAMIEYYLTTLR